MWRRPKRKLGERAAAFWAEAWVDASEAHEQLLPRDRRYTIAALDSVCGLRRRSVLSVLVVLGGAVGQEASCPFELGLDVAAGEDAKVADFGESCGQYVIEEAPDEFERRDGDGLAVLGGEANPVVVECLDAVVGYADAVSVAAEVAKDVLDPSKGALGIDDP